MISSLDVKAVDFILIFDSLADAIQHGEVITAAEYYQEYLMYNGKKRYTVIMGIMPFELLLSLCFCKRNTLCTVNVHELNIVGKVLWDSRI